MNPRFRDTWLGRIIGSPLRITLDVNVNLGPGLERHVLERDSIRYGMMDSAELHGKLRREPKGLFDGIVKLGTQLGLTRARILTVDSLSTVDEARRKAAYGLLAQWMATVGRTASMTSFHERWRQARFTDQTSEAREGHTLRHVLTLEQLAAIQERGGLFNGAASAEDDRELHRMLAKWRRPPLP